MTLKNRLLDIGIYSALMLPLISSCGFIRDSSDSVLDSVSAFIPPEVIAQLDSQSWNSIRSSVAVIEDETSNRLFADLVEPLIKTEAVAKNFHLTWNFKIIQSQQLNAFALPGGTIAVHTGLIDKSESGLEFIGVLGHEIAHVIERHSLKSIVVQSGASLVLALVFGEMFGLSGFALDTAANLGLLKFSRDYEREADKVGAQILLSAEYPSVGLRSFFLQLEASQEQVAKDKPELLQSALSLLSTHPMSEERAKNLTEIVADNPHRTLSGSAAKTYSALRSRVKELQTSDSK